MIQFIICLFSAFFGGALTLALISAVINFFGKASIWLVIILGGAIYAWLFAAPDSWTWFFSKLLCEAIYSAISISSLVLMWYLIVSILTNKKFFLGYIIFTIISFFVYCLTL